MGPLEYVVIEFEGNHFTGEILPELNALHDQGVLRVVDLIFIQKDQNGNVTARELSDLSDEEAKPFGPMAGDMLRLLTPEDIDDVAESVPDNSSAAIALFEHTWAIHLKETIQHARGRVITAGMVPGDEVEALAAELAAEQASVPQ
jgi:uncharacterized membrane protein